MNRLMQAARKFRRVILKQEKLFGAVVAIEVLVFLYLIIWSVIDAPSRQTHFELTDTQTEEGEYVAQFSDYCASDSDGWMIGAVAWNFLLIVCATMFAFITRTFESHFRETQVCGMAVA